MPNRPAGQADGRLDRDFAEIDVVEAGGGFTLEAPTGILASAIPDGDGWRVRMERARGNRRLVREEVAGDGFVLEASPLGRTDDDRTSHVHRRGLGPVSVLLADGRVFWIVSEAAGDPAFRVEGWEAPGAYWTATRRDGRWRLCPTPAGEELTGAEPLLVLLAAELLDLEACETRAAPGRNGAR